VTARAKLGGTEVAERRDPRTPRPTSDRPVFHFDTGLVQDHLDHEDGHHDGDYQDHFHEDHEDHEDHVDDGPPHEDHVDHHTDIHEDHQDQDDHYDRYQDVHGDQGRVTDWLLDRLQALIKSVQQDLVTRQQRLEQQINERLTAVENEAERVVRELGEHVRELGLRVDDATADEPHSGRPSPRDPRG
jgi:hypothetical protein